MRYQGNGPSRNLPGLYVVTIGRLSWAPMPWGAVYSVLQQEVTGAFETVTITRVR